MKGKVKGFRSEAELVRRGRRLIKEALRSLETDVRTRYEVPVPGGVPDLVIFSKKGQAVQYVVTIEFKLGDWRRAVAQAFRHRNFGNEAYVVLDQARLAAALRHLEVFQQANVGLVTVDARDTVRIWHYPEPGLPFSSQVSRAVARALLAPRRTLPNDLPFIRSVRGGVTLAGLRAWSPTHVARGSVGRPPSLRV
jgi:hypothetical protein